MILLSKPRNDWHIKGGEHLTHFEQFQASKPNQQVLELEPSKESSENTKSKPDSMSDPIREEELPIALRKGRR